MLNGFGDCVEMGKNNWSVHSVSMVSSWYYCEEVLPSRSCDKSTTVDTFMQMGIKRLNIPSALNSQFTTQVEKNVLNMTPYETSESKCQRY